MKKRLKQTAIAWGLALVALGFPCLACAQTAQEPRHARTNCEANVREGPSSAEPILFALAAGTEVVVTEIVQQPERAWCAVEVVGLSGKKGYILQSLLDFADETSAPTAPPQEATVAQATGAGRQCSEEYYLEALRDPMPLLSFSPDDATLAQYQTLREGSRGDAVVALKARLYELGYYRQEQTGAAYTESTADVIARFQALHGLPADGVATPLTQALLFSQEAMGAEAAVEETRNVRITGGRIVRYRSSSAVQIEFANETGLVLTGFSLRILPYSAYGEPVDLGATLAEELNAVYQSDACVVGRGGTYSDVEEGHYFVIRQGEFYTGALVAVTGYQTQQGDTVRLPAGQWRWFAIEGADIAGAALPEETEATARERALAQAWSLGAQVQPLIAAYRSYYGLPEGLGVSAVAAGSLAEQAGVQPGDVLLALNGVPLVGEETLTRAMAVIAPGDVFELIFWRSGVYFTAEMAL